MKFTLKDYQRDAVRDSLDNLAWARQAWHTGRRPHAFSLAAVTGAGKTVMATATFEALFHGDDDLNFDADPGAVVIWFSDDPSLNEQTRFRIIEASDRINHTDLVVVENTFNRAKFEAGKIYFLNTQKLGKNSLLVRGHDPEEVEARAGGLLPQTRPDLRSHTIWDTIHNTIEDPELTLYLVLDEAHRGMGTPTAAGQNAKSTIVQRLINGTGRVPGIPVVWGISATVERFDAAMASSQRHIKMRNVVVDSSKVQDSGLIKDAIVLAAPEESGQVDTVFVRRAADRLRESTIGWAEYAQQQDEPQAVVPLMVLQIPNTPDPAEVGRWLDIIYEQFPELPTASVANVLGERTSRRYGNRDVPYIEPQRVQESNWVRVLVAKDAISTGWDCPRAEVMVSFRPANDQTHITQLLGRMIRSPLARRIPGNDRLNAVDCLLPKFNRRTVDSVVDALTRGGEMLPTAGRVLVDPIEVRRNPSADAAVWAAFEAVPSQSRPQRGAKPAKRLTALAHELVSDEILPGAGATAHAAIHAVLDGFQSAHADTIMDKRRSVMTVDGRTVVAHLGDKAKSFEQFWEDADMPVIDDAYRRAARVISPDIARSYVDHLAAAVADREEDPEAFLEAIVEARVKVAALGLVTELQWIVDRAADTLAREWLITYREAIRALSDDRKEAYRQVAEMSAEPQDIALLRPESRYEATNIKDGDTITPIRRWTGHLLCDGTGHYPAHFISSWERVVVETETARDGARFWYRNPQQPGLASLGVAYRSGEEWKILRPDFLFFAEDQGRVVVDLIDPHGFHLADALPKLQGLAAYAEAHSASYRRMEAVAEAHGKLRRLDLTKPDVRQAIVQAADAANLFASVVATDYQ